MKKILILANHYITIYAFRKELVEELIKEHEVYIAYPKSGENDYFEGLGCKVIDTPLQRRNTNPISDLKLLMQYLKIIKNIRPDKILTYTIKPNIYGGIASRLKGINTIHTVTGLGSVYIRDMWQKKFITFMNKLAFKKAETVFFLNDDNKEFYKKLGIVNSEQKTIIVPGSGVNLQRFNHKELENNQVVTFTFIARILKDKGIEEFLSAAKEIKTNYQNTLFRVVGFVDEEKYKTLLHSYEERGIIEYLGRREDIPEIMGDSDCVVLPSYGEGRGTVLQEAAAIGRPLITTNTYGCKENVDDGENGFLCEVQNVNTLISAMEKFLLLSYIDKKSMGNKSRVKAEKEFDRNIVINYYLSEIKG
ncbi:glycosyltransferase family 4 protein [Oceanobacillus sojae]|uniref:glycosyltransferase family 4 protein n=1 Tax=Oceanobacillus sojae TaxID=582851 RepID=UPI0021A7475D|nr:glycosyltransferase family 4 protein [Oceanobacillus sojae]MCT1901854.1 glycosyltransferase family 4 protein [Oceanobacillus sojae]